MRRYLIASGLMAISLAVSACDENLTTLAGPTPNLEPTFASVQANIFELTDSAGRRACTNCHTNIGRVPAGGLNLLHDAAYDQIVNVPSFQRPAAMRVQPGDPDASYLVHKVEGRTGISGLRMPFTPPYLADGQITILRRWIQIGAPRN
jgi:hypothetical protein